MLEKAEDVDKVAWEDAVRAGEIALKTMQGATPTSLRVEVAFVALMGAEPAEGEME